MRKQEENKLCENSSYKKDRKTFSDRCGQIARNKTFSDVVRQQEQDIQIYISR
jgi:hypothetical protein